MICWYKGLNAGVVAAGVATRDEIGGAVLADEGMGLRNGLFGDPDDILYKTEDLLTNAAQRRTLQG